jgi:hypothetical protein
VQDFLDLQAGWKLQVVIPKLRSGGYTLPSVKRAAANSSEIKVGDDFLGYERDLYDILRRDDGGIRLRFRHAEVWDENRKMHRKSLPSLPLLEDATKARFVRLVYLIRVSSADHNMAIVSSNDVAALSELTQAVVQKAECNNSERAACRWVPEGIAVTPIQN